MKDLDDSFSTTLAQTAPTPGDQKAFTILINKLFVALKPLASTKNVSDSMLSAALEKVDCKAITTYFSNFETKLMKIDKQMTYIETQYKQLDDFQKTVRKAMETFTKELPKFPSATKDSKDKGKKLWIEPTEKLYSDQKKNGEKIQNALRVNANIDQTISASSASAKITAFYGNFYAAITDANIVFSAQLFDQYVFSMNEETAFTNHEVLIITNLVTYIADTLFANADERGIKCVKDLSDTFVTMIKQYQSNLYTCFEDFSTYVAFSTEFINLKLTVIKCQSEDAINYLPACFKQISKKTSKTYSNAMYNTCLQTVSDFNATYLIFQLIHVS